MRTPRQSSSPFAGRGCKMGISVKVMVWINAPKAGIVGFTIFPGKPENSGKIPVNWESKNLGKSTPLHPTSNWFRLVPKQVGTYSTMRKYIWDLFHTTNIALGPIPPLQYFKWDLFHLCNISSGTYSTFSIFQVGPIPQSQKSFWDLFHSLNFFFKHHGWNRSQLEVEKVPIILGPIPPPIGTYSTLKLCGTNSKLNKKWDLFHRFNWDLVHL